MGEEGGLAICDYPLRAVRLNTTAARLLQRCSEQCTCQELAVYLRLPIKRVQALCEQLRWKGLLEAGPTPPPASWPSITIIIPSHNRTGQLQVCLRSLCKLDYPVHCLEMLIVDDASTDETPAMLAQVMQEFEAEGRMIRVVRHTFQQGVAKSRNTGAEAARHDLLAYIDSDCVASPDWLAELVPAFQNENTAAVGGMIRAYERKSMLGRYEDIRSSLYMGVRPQLVSIEGPLKYLPTANLLVRREMWQEIGGFAPLTFGEDVDFCRRLLATKARIIYLPQGLVYHDYRTRLWAFLTIRASYASAEAALLQRHPQERRVLILPPEQATFAGSAVGGLWLTMVGFLGMWRGSRSATVDWAKTSHIPVPQIPFPYYRRAGLTIVSIVGAMACPRPVSGADTSPFHRLSSRLWGENHCRTLPGGQVNPVWGTGILSRLLGGSCMFLLALILTLLGTYKRWQKVRKQRVPIRPFTIFRATLRGHLAYTYHLCRHLTRYYTLPLVLIGLVLPPLLMFVLILIGIVVGVDYVRLGPEMSLGKYALCAMLDDCAYEVGVVWGCMKHGTWKPLWPIVRKK